MAITAPAGEPALYLGGYPVREPASLTLALAGVTLMAMRRRAAVAPV